MDPVKEALLHAKTDLTACITIQEAGTPLKAYGLRGTVEKIDRALVVVNDLASRAEKAREEALREAAQIADDYDTGGYGQQNNMAVAQTVSAEIRAAILSLIGTPAPAALGWRDIASAPKDGTPIDLWCEARGLVSRDSDETRAYVSFRVPDCVWSVDGWLDTDGNRHPTLADWPDLRPTHWQPLPAPPSNIKNP